jgi:hypothetical protein
VEELKRQLDDLLNRSARADELRSRLKDLVSIYPFNEYEYLISHLLAEHKLAIEEYYELRNEYLARNLNAKLFEIGAPRKFGEAWAEGYVKELVPVLERPSKALDPSYEKGMYDFILPPRIRVEVKASRAVEYKNAKAMQSKALHFDSTKHFDMNFQQLKPRCCDVFVWLGVWLDVIKCWVIPSSKVKEIYKPQHRGNIGEGQFHLKQSNIQEFSNYEVDLAQLEEAIRGAYDEEITLRQIQS